MAVIARFKTAYDQKEIVVDALVTVSAVGTAGSNAANYVTNDGAAIVGLPVGTVVNFNGTTITEVINPNGAYHESSPDPVAITDAMYIIAQSDATMSYGHVPVETLSYKYIGKEDFVGAKASVPKPVALFKITDPTDVVVGIR